MEFSPAGDTIVSCNRDVRLWDTKTEKEIRWTRNSTRDEVNEVNAAAFSPDGTKIVWCGDDKKVHLWSVRTGEPIGKPWEGHNRWVVAVAFSPSGRTIASGDSYSTILIWNTETGQQLNKLSVGRRSIVSALAFSPDERMLASASWAGSLYFSDVRTGIQLGNTVTVERELNMLAFSPDGKALVGNHRDMYTGRIVAEHRLVVSVP